MLDAIVCGGGVAGLACAFRLRRAGLDPLVLEAEAVPGGNVRSEPFGGAFRAERGPHTFMASARDVFALVAESGLHGALTGTRAAAHRRFIVRGGKLHAVPTGPWSFLQSRLLTFRGKWKLAGEPFRTRRGDPGESALTFFERRFGPEAARVLAGAFISGVYAGDPASLSAPAAFPLFWRFEQESGGMIRGAIRLRRERRAEREARSETGPAPRGLFSFAQGLGQLTATLAAELGDGCRASTPVRAVSRSGAGFAVETEQETLLARQVVVATPPHAAARLVAGLDPALAEALGGVVMAPIAVVHMGFHKRAQRVPDGFGFLVPRGEGVRSLGVLFPSRLFDGRAPEGGDLLSGFLGGALDPGALELDDASLVRTVRQDLLRLTGFDGAPDVVQVRRYPRAIPQLVLGHLARMESIQGRLSGLPGLALAGNYLRGVGLKDAVGSGFEAARRLLEVRTRGVAV